MSRRGKTYFVEIDEAATSYNITNIIVTGMGSLDEAEEMLQEAIDSAAIDLGTYEPWEVELTMEERPISAEMRREYPVISRIQIEELLDGGVLYLE